MAILTTFFTFLFSFSVTKGGSPLRQIQRQPVQQPELHLLRQLLFEGLQGRQKHRHR